MRARTSNRSEEPLLSKFISQDPQRSSLEGFSAVLQEIHEYASAQEGQPHAKLSLTDLAAERFAKVEAISVAIDQLAFSCSLAQSEKLDCLEQALKAVKALHCLGGGRGQRGMREERGEISKVGRQKEMNLLQKLTDLLLDTMLPEDPQPKYMQQLLSTLFEMFFSARTGSQELKPKEKRKREPQTVTVVEYCLLSGHKINLPWLIVFRILQKKYHHVAQPSPASKEELAETIQTHISKPINAVLTFVFQLAEPHPVLKNLLSCLVDSVKEMELPIVPFFLKAFYAALEQEVKDAYSLHGCIPPHLLLGKAIYSLDNLNTLCSLINNIHQSMSSLQMRREFINLHCSYCGLESSEKEAQSVRVRLNSDDQLVIKVCLECCRELGVEAEQRLELMALAPLVYSRYWDWQHSSNADQIRSCLRHLLLFHSCSPSKKPKGRKVVMPTLAESIAMNNVEEKANPQVVEGIYQAFLFTHARLSLKDVIYETLNLLLIPINTLDEKLKEKTLKVLNQPHILSFIFNEAQRTPSLYAEQVANFREKFLAIMLIKLRDVSLSVRVAALELLSGIYAREDVECALKVDFYHTIYREIAFSNNPDFMAKAIHLIDRSLFKLPRNNAQQTQAFVQIVGESLEFSRQCLQGLKQAHPLKAQLAKLIGKLLQTVIELTEQDYEFEEQARDIASAFNSVLRVKTISAGSLQAVGDVLMTQMLSGAALEREVIRSFPRVTPSLLDALISDPESEQSEHAASHNLLELVSIVFEDITEARQAIFGPFEKPCSKTRPAFNTKELRKFFFSRSFFLRILSRKESSKASRRLLTQLLSFSNFCRLVDEHSVAAGVVLKSFVKGREKWRECVQLTNAEVLGLAAELGNCVREQMMVCSPDSIAAHASLFASIKYFLQQTPSLEDEIEKYRLFASKHIAALALSQDHNYSNLVKTHSLVTRALAILTALAVSYEKIVSFDSFLEKAEHRVMQSRRKSTKEVKEANRLMVRPSLLFQNCYRLVSESVAAQAEQSDPRLQEMARSQPLLLCSYWQVYPELLADSGELLGQVRRSESGVKAVYGLFLSLLPTSDMRLLTLINHHVGESLYGVFSGSLREEQMLEHSFRLLQHMLRSGMTGLCGINRFIFLGLLHPAPSVSAIAGEIIREVYSTEASERMLFANFADTLSFLFESYFKGEVPELTGEQVGAVRLVASVTRPHEKSLLVKEKRELRLRPSFAKKISEVLTERKRLLQDHPLFLIFLLRLAQAQESFDYSELYELLFSVNRLATEAFSFAEHLREELEDHEEWPVENLEKSVRIYTAYRELLSCLAYLANYQPVQKQLAAYDRLFDATPAPYVSLARQIPPSQLPPHPQVITVLDHDIELYLDVLAGSVEGIGDLGRRQQGREEEDSNTNETKPKAKRSRSKRPNRNKTKNGRNLCVSEEKRRRTRGCSKEDSSSSFPSARSIY